MEIRIKNSDVRLAAGDGRHFSAYLAKSETANGAAIVLLQEIFGVNPNIRAIADDLAASGFTVIAPDLFWRQKPDVQLDPSSEKDRERAAELLKGLDQSAAVDDATVALDYVLSLPGINGRAGAVGYCLGGKLAYLLAVRSKVHAAVSYYGVGIQLALDEAPLIRGKLLLHLAGNDHLCPPEAQQKIATAMKPLGDKVVVLAYSNVGHAFARRNSSPFDRDAAERADLATMAFLKNELVD